MRPAPKSLLARVRQLLADAEGPRFVHHPGCVDTGSLRWLLPETFTAGDRADLLHRLDLELRPDPSEVNP